MKEENKKRRKELQQEKDFFKNRIFFRKEIEDMNGYAPGEQPKRVGGWIKLNTNENPYPPSPTISEYLKSFDDDILRFYPSAMACEFRKCAADLNNVKIENIIAGNGSDDILTIAIRSFVSENNSVACPEPSYSLYPVLAQLQGASCNKIALNDDFSLPNDFVKQAGNAKLLLIPRPNAPTGTLFSKKKMQSICEEFNGIVLIDEAYADFADDSCVDFVNKFDNVIISRTLSKSYSLAGIRVGYAISSSIIIDGMMKVKDSYNINALSQNIALLALKDQGYFNENVRKICETRKKTSTALKELGFQVIPSAANFLLTSPPDCNGKRLYEELKENGILVRWFSGDEISKFIRISIGTDKEMDNLLDLIAKLQA